MNHSLRKYGEKDYKREYLKDIFGILYLPLSFVYMEILAKLQIFGKAVDDKFKYLLFLSMAMGFFLSIAAMLLPGRPRRIFYRVTLAVLAVWFSFHVSYHNNFHTFFSWNSLGQAKDVTQFWKEAIVAAAGVWYVILAFFVPLIIICVIGNLLVPDALERNILYAGIACTAFVSLYLPMLVYINFTKGNSDVYTPYYYYTYLQNDLDTSFEYYGIINATRLDMKQLIFGAPIEEIDISDLKEAENHIAKDDEPEQKEYGWNTMEIDFDKAAQSAKSDQLKSMDQYFKNVQPTRKNEYTGYFEGKNLIFITLEGFSDKVIDPEFTPILYKMSTEGFVFKNFYNTVWGGSTGTGEYTNITGNFYGNSSCLVKSADTSQPFVLANQFKKLGYKTVGYHNNSYTYYGRDKSHPNFGYKWKAIGNGLKLTSNCWPRSDKEMAEATVDDYVGQNQPFHAYYMSVSGHANYTFSGNMMSTRHKKDVPERLRKNAEDVYAYYACQYEVELMLEVLVNKLEEAGELDNTVFAMTADHYPYALSDEGLSILYGLPQGGIRKNFDLYRNGFILWSSSMTEPVVVDSPCSAIDILPTISNLFGLEYDSRLIMGSDILADSEHFALLKVSGWSWVSTQGEYRAASKTFIPSVNCTLTESERDDYINRMNKIIKAKTTYSPQMLNKDYYGHIMKFVNK